MTIPKLRDVHYTSKRVKKSVSWLYRMARAGRIPCTRVGDASVEWTDEQIVEIIRNGARPAVKSEAGLAPKVAAPGRERRKRNAKPTNARSPGADATDVPQADFTISRLYREGVS